MRLGVLRRELGGDPSTLGNGESLTASPLADLRGLTGTTMATASASPVGRLRAATAEPASRTDVAREPVAQLGGVLVAQVDLVRRPIESERNRLGAGSFVVVQIADENDLHALRH